MKRDIDLIRAILLEVERHEEDKHINHLEIDGYSQDEIRYNVYLLYKAHLIEGNVMMGMNSIKPQSFIISRMTWEGHEFLDAVRNDSVWARVKGKLAQVGGDAPLEVVKAVAVKVVLDLVT